MTASHIWIQTLPQVLILLILNLDTIIIICEVHELHLVLHVSFFYRAWLHVLLDYRIRLQFGLRLVQITDIYRFTFLPICLLLGLLSVILVLKWLILGRVFTIFAKFKQIGVITCNRNILSLLSNQTFFALFVGRFHFFFNIFTWTRFGKSRFICALCVLEILLRPGHIRITLKIFVATIKSFLNLLTLVYKWLLSSSPTELNFNAWIIFATCFAPLKSGTFPRY